MHKPLLFVAVGLLAVAAGIFLSSYFGSGPGTPEDLAQLALAGDTPEARERAALQLAARGRAAREQMRRVLAEGKSPEVIAATAEGLGAIRDFDSMPRLLDLLDNSAEKVRDRAGVAVASILGADYRFRANDAAPKRNAAVQAMRAEYKRLVKSPPPEYKGN